MAANRPNSEKPDDSGLNQLITYRVSRLHAQLNAHSTRLLQAHSDLSLTEWRVLVMLDTWHDVSAAEIARRSRLDKGQLSRCIKGMIDRGLVTSANSLTDNRTQILKLTETGRSLHQKLRPHMRARQHVLNDAIGADALPGFLAAIDRLEAAIAGTDEGKE